MRLFVRTALLLLLISLALPLTAESPRSLYNKGKDAEARQDYMAAFEHYRQAYDQKPKELKYRIAYQRTRFLASAGHVNKGQDLREKGNLAEALQEFVYAAKIDPSNAVAGQEARKTQAMIEAASGSGQAAPPKPMSPITKRLEEAAGPIELTPVSSQPITLEISNDSKLVYETMGRLAGINVLFDPDYASRRITLKLNAVSLQESLDILAFHSNTFWRPVTPNTIFVAANTPAKRRDLEQNILKTFYLSNVNAASDLVEVMNVIRTILGTSDFKIMQVNSQNAIVVRGTPDQVALAEKLIGDLDKAKPEVIVEVAVMQVRRDKLRDIGIRPPTSASSALSVGIQPPTATTGTTGTTTGATTSNLTLNTLANLKDKDIVVNIPAATVNLLYNDNNSRLIQNPQIRALDGQKAALKIGDRIPIATGSFGSGFGAGGLGASGLVNTQFQYIDVGVNVDITPRVFMNREVGLKLVLEISSVTGSTNIGGITQPIISQRRVEHEIRLREGEVNLLGGIFEQQTTKSISGLPGLAQLPFLKYLFAEERNENVESEIVFILIPHIVRGQEYTELNQRAIDVGTNTTLDLRRVSRPAGVTPSSPAPQSSAPTSSAPAAAPAGAPAQTAPTSQSATNPNQPSSGNEATPQTQEPAAPGMVFFDPAAASQPLGRTFNVNVMVRGAKDLYSAPMQISYDPNTLQLVNISNGDLLSRDGQPVALVHREDLQGGVIQANATRPPNTGGISGDGVLYTLTFQTKAKGDSTLNIVRPSFRNSGMQPVQMTTSTASMSVK
ncbi:MAG TPA: cohesin domain-containing protein [Terriglobales bacterium]|nr:cohesin domain-containing protein [Terriglobales bacterium]